MATAQDIIDIATLRLGRRPAGTAFNSYQSSMNSELFEALQNLISELTADNCLHIPTPTSTSTTLDLYDEQIRALGLLATRDFIPILRVRDVNPVLMRQIEDAERNLSSDNNISMAVEMPGLSFAYKYDIASDT